MNQLMTARRGLLVAALLMAVSLAPGSARADAEPVPAAGVDATTANAFKTWRQAMARVTRIGWKYRGQYYSVLLPDQTPLYGSDYHGRFFRDSGRVDAETFHSQTPMRGPQGDLFPAASMAVAARRAVFTGREYWLYLHKGANPLELYSDQQPVYYRRTDTLTPALLLACIAQTHSAGFDGNLSHDGLFVFDELDHALSVVRGESAIVEGASCEVFDVTTRQRGKLKLWLDPNAEYLPRKIVSTRGASDAFGDGPMSATPWPDPVGGKPTHLVRMVWTMDGVKIGALSHGQKFPIACRLEEEREFASGTRMLIRTTHERFDIDENPDFTAAKAFVVKLPDGAAVQVEGAYPAKYVLKDGQPVLVSAAASRPSATQPARPPVVVAPPSSLNTWAKAFIGLAALAVAAILIVKWRQRSSSSSA